MCQNKIKNKKPVYISKEMEQEFIIFVRNIIRRCEFDLSFDDVWDLPLFLYANDIQSLPIGMSDGELYVIDSELMYNLFCSHWNNLFKLLTNQSPVPKQKVFYKKLYHKGVLAKGTLYNTPEYPYLRTPKDTRRPCFCIEGKRLGFKEDLSLKWAL